MASGGRIKGITVEIGGDTGPLSSALKGVNGTIRETGSQLKDINRLLKLDPTNVTLLGQKAGAAQKELLALQEKEKTLKAADSDLKKQLSEGKISTEQYQAYQRELVAPYAGAWIEIFACCFASPKRKKSHPTRVRGLK